MIQLPIVESGPDFSVGVEIEGVSFTFRLLWNARAEAWFCDVKSADGTLLVSGVKIVVELPLLGRFGLASLPAGVVLALDRNGGHVDAGFADLGRRVAILYLTQAEYAAL